MDFEFAEDKVTGPKAGVGSSIRVEVWFADADPDTVALLQENVERCLGTRTLEGRLGQVPKAPPLRCNSALGQAELKNHKMTRHQ